MREIRENETDEERQIRREKNRERMRKLRSVKKKTEDMSDEDFYKDIAESEEELSDIVKKMNEKHRMNEEIDIRTVDEGQVGIETCICDIDIDCPYCQAQMEDEKYLYTINTEEEKARYEKEEIEGYKSMIRNKRKERRTVLLEKAKNPLPPLPVRELSEYEKIREEFIAQRKKEWEIYEKEWEKQWQDNKQG